MSLADHILLDRSYRYGRHQCNECLFDHPHEHCGGCRGLVDELDLPLMWQFADGVCDCLYCTRCSRQHLQATAAIYFDAAAKQIRAIGARYEDNGDLELAGEVFAAGGNVATVDYRKMVRRLSQWKSWRAGHAQNDVDELVELLDLLAELEDLFDGVNQIASLVDDWRESQDRPGLMRASRRDFYEMTKAG